MQYVNDDGYLNTAFEDQVKNIVDEMVSKLPVDVANRKDYLAIQHAVKERVSFKLAQKAVEMQYYTNPIIKE